LIAASGLLGVSAHLTNAVKDLDADAATGVRGLPQRLGVRISTVASTVVLIVALALFLGLPDRLRVSTVALAAVAVALSAVAVIRALRGQLRALFELSVVAVLPLIVAVAVTGGVRG
jgi:4-hydroxybenzoate polyprenyltransferase